MAFSNGLSERMEELRYPNPRSPIDEPSYSGFASPPRGQASIFAPFPQSTTEARAGLPRRFTTDSSKLTTLASLGQNNGPQVPSNPFSEAQLWEKKRQKIEAVREQKRKFEEQMKLLDLEERQLQQSNGQEMETVSRAFNRTSLGAAPVSEPTTPPEFADNAFPSSLSKPGRFSMGLMSPPGLANNTNRFSQSSVQLPSPVTASKVTPTSQAQTQNNRMSIKSMPGSRRNSDEEDDFYDEELPPTRATNNNRFSMPATGMKAQNRLSTFSSGSGIGSFAGPSYFGDVEEDKSLRANNPVDLTSDDAKMYMQMTNTDDTFPTLRSDTNSGSVRLQVQISRSTTDVSQLHANPAAIDLAASKDTDPESWASFTRHRPAHQSMPQNGLTMFNLNAQIHSPPSDKADFAPMADKKSQRHSMGVGFNSIFDSPATPARSMTSSRPQSLQSSYSTNDLPTVKSSNVLANVPTPSKTHAEQHFHNHNVSIGRFPAGAVSNRQSRDMSTLMSPEVKRDDKPQATAVPPSSLQPSAPAFGPTSSFVASNNGSVNGFNQNNGSYGGVNNQSYAYGMQPYNQLNNGYSQVNAYQNGQSYNQYQPYPNANRSHDGQGRLASTRRFQSEDGSRFNNSPLENYVGDIYHICKDQHGCRYLQRKLEEKNPESTRMIFEETCPPIAELMIDPFGNYLCQKLFEYCTRDQRTALILSAETSMVTIALNQHGTRALQKMIEYVDTPEQVQIVIRGLKDQVVRLVQDLNGNHVIQKCLNRLSNQEAQFIYEAAGENCVIIGTHRHGCCVLQRCIDHASVEQRGQLIARITQDAFDLVQDPFGNYVVQYILDLSEPAFTTPLCENFCGNIPALSKQKFSSNVIEKCLRTSQQPVKRQMIEEMLRPAEMEKMLKDSFANYVVQTALDFADSETKIKMIETIRPILPAIKQTPHGRRIATKIMASDTTGRLSGSSSGHVTPNEMASPAFGSTRNGNTGSGRRQAQVYGASLFQGVNAAPRYIGNGMNGADNYNSAGYAQVDYSAMNGGGQSSYENPMYNPHGHTAGASQQHQAFQSYAGSQPGPGYF